MCLLTSVSGSSGPQQYHRPRNPPSLAPLHFRAASPSPSEDYSTPPPPISPTDSYYPVDHKEPPVPLPSLRQGDVVFWHHLARTGEIAPVAHDERARQPPAPKRPRPILFNR